jgi:enterochelin esterase-like enzyme
MNRVLWLAVAAALLVPQAADDSRPASSNVRGAQYPRVHPDGRISFRVVSKTAQKVQVQAGTPEGMGGGPFDMQRDQDGVWTVTTPPAAPGFHYYWFLVDGFQTNDPSSETYFGWARYTSGIEVPEPGVDFYLLKDVPHGQVRQHVYYSKITAAWRRAFVYLPPAYDTSGPRTRYPVLYLQHGAGENEEGWTRQGRANVILDNLLAEKRAAPMIVVMDCGYATSAAPAAAPAAPPAGGRAATGQPNVFENVLLDEIIPEIDRTYRTLADRDHRALAGLSMGAGQALQIGLAHLDRFSAIGALSRAGARTPFDPKTAYNGVFADPAAFNRKVRVFWWGAGTVETAIHDGAKTTVLALNEAGVKAEFVESPGTAHEWQTWRRGLRDFAPRLFR